MNKIKLTAFGIILLIVSGMVTGCGKDDKESSKEQSIVGTWEMENLSSNEEDESNLDISLLLDIKYTFNEDNTCFVEAYGEKIEFEYSTSDIKTKDGVTKGKLTLSMDDEEESGNFSIKDNILTLEDPDGDITFRRVK